MSRALRLILILALLAALAFWLIIVAVASDYHESTILLLGVLWLLAAFTLSWKTEHFIVKVIAIILIILAMSVIGNLAIKAGVYRRQVQTIITQNILQEAARQLLTQMAEGKALPDCDWMCMMQTLQEAGTWSGLEVPYENTDKTTKVTGIPRNDEWGCKYIYEHRGDLSFIMKSSGADRRFGTADDIVIDNSNLLPDKPLPIPVYSGLKH